MTRDLCTYGTGCRSSYWAILNAAPVYLPPLSVPPVCPNCLPPLPAAACHQFGLCLPVPLLMSLFVVSGQVYSGAELQYRLTGLEPQTDYQARLCCRSPAGESGPFTGALRFSTPAAPPPPPAASRATAQHHTAKVGPVSRSVCMRLSADWAEAWM